MQFLVTPTKALLLWAVIAVALGPESTEAAPAVIVPPVTSSARPFPKVMVGALPTPSASKSTSTTAAPKATSTAAAAKAAPSPAPAKAAATAAPAKAAATAAPAKAAATAAPAKAAASPAPAKAAASPAPAKAAVTSAPAKLAASGAPAQPNVAASSAAPKKVDPVQKALKSSIPIAKLEVDVAKAQVGFAKSKLHLETLVETKKVDPKAVTGGVVVPQGKVNATQAAKAAEAKKVETIKAGGFFNLF